MERSEMKNLFTDNRYYIISILLLELSDSLLR